MLVGNRVWQIRSEPLLQINLALWDYLAHRDEFYKAIHTRSHHPFLRTRVFHSFRTDIFGSING